MRQVYLKRGKEESLLRFHPWVFSGAIQQMDNGIEEGELVRVLTDQGDFMLYCRSSTLLPRCGRR